MAMHCETKTRSTTRAVWMQQHAKKKGLNKIKIKGGIKKIISAAKDMRKEETTRLGDIGCGAQPRLCCCEDALCL